MYTLNCYMNMVQEFPYIKTLELTSWQRSYFSSDIKRRNKGGALVC